MGKGGGTCPSLEMLVFLCISSYSKTLNRPIVYALILQFAVGF